MEASENTMSMRGFPHEPVLQRVDGQRITELLSPGGVHTRGFARLELMLETILPRLTGEQADGRSGQQ